MNETWKTDLENFQLYGNFVQLKSLFSNGAQGRNRTTDTGIFSPLLALCKVLICKA